MVTRIDILNAISAEGKVDRDAIDRVTKKLRLPPSVIKRALVISQQDLARWALGRLQAAIKVIRRGQHDRQMYLFVLDAIQVLVTELEKSGYSPVDGLEEDDEIVIRCVKVDRHSNDPNLKNIAHAVRYAAMAFDAESDGNIFYTKIMANHLKNLSYDVFKSPEDSSMLIWLEIVAPGKNDNELPLI